MSLIRIIIYFVMGIILGEIATTLWGSFSFGWWILLMVGGIATALILDKLGIE